MKRKIFIAVCAFFLCVLTACSSTKAVGTWYLIEEADKDGILLSEAEAADYNFTMELYENGTGVISVDDESAPLRWDKKTITILSDGSSYPYTIKDNKLVLYIDYAWATFAKKK